MAKNTHCHQLIDAKTKIRNAIYDDQRIVALLVDDQYVSGSSSKYEDASKRILDYRYTENTVQEAGAWVMVETEIAPSYASNTTCNLTVYVQILCSQLYMDLKGWRGVTGNRRDNLLIEIDRVINGSRDFGIGRLTLESASPIAAPNGFSSMLLTYVVPDFAVTRGVGNYV